MPGWVDIAGLLEIVAEKWRTSPRLQGVGVMVKFGVTTSAMDIPLNVKAIKKIRPTLTQELIQFVLFIMTDTSFFILSQYYIIRIGGGRQWAPADSPPARGSRRWRNPRCRATTASDVHVHIERVVRYIRLLQLV